MSRLNSVRHIDGKVFILSEKISDYRTACLAQAEYWAEGLCCRKEAIADEMYYNIWVGPERKVKVKLLPGEEISRLKGTLMRIVS